MLCKPFKLGTYFNCHSYLLQSRYQVCKGLGKGYVGYRKAGEATLSFGMRELIGAAVPSVIRIKAETKKVQVVTTIKLPGSTVVSCPAVFRNMLTQQRATRSTA
jgi:hypothetical protein